ANNSQLETQPRSHHLHDVKLKRIRGPHMNFSGDSEHCQSPGMGCSKKETRVALVLNCQFLSGECSQTLIKARSSRERKKKEEGKNQRHQVGNHESLGSHS